MRKKYKNELFLALSTSVYGIERFDIIEYDDNGLPAVKIFFKNSPFYFIIRGADNDFDSFDTQFVIYAPNFPENDVYPAAGWANFNEVLRNLNHWINKHISEYLNDEEEPDLWEEFKKGDKKFNVHDINFDEKENFSTDEKTQILLSLNELKLLINKDIAKNAEEKQIVNDRIDYLIEATNRLNKFDWKGLAISTLLSISTALSLDTQKGHLLFELFKRVFVAFYQIAQ